LSDHIHILGICGTFMGGLALLARESGFSVTGSDRNIYPPMSTQLLSSDIPLLDGYGAEQLSPTPDCVVVGNALSRGQPVVEAMLSGDIPYTSGPEWLGRHILQDQWVLAVSGTHGKTSTASMLAWILEQAGLQPGFLIGGIPSNFGLSARLGGGDYFVVEADEYDSAFFDKRSKFVHYRPKTAVINNLEYDHADIFPDLAAIETQFHHLVRCIPGDGLIVRGGGEAIDRVLEKGLLDAGRDRRGTHRMSNAQAGPGARCLLLQTRCILPRLMVRRPSCSGNSLVRITRPMLPLRLRRRITSECLWTSRSRR
jgi:UDP-N-acetylmuramate: L-alanyl-gamma-D-glutamyl-meso-diaminopimelate ligase